MLEFNEDDFTTEVVVSKHQGQNLVLRMTPPHPWESGEFPALNSRIKQWGKTQNMKYRE